MTKIDFNLTACPIIYFKAIQLAYFSSEMMTSCVTEWLCVYIIKDIAGIFM